MIIEIRGPSIHNKGAELMAHAVLQHFRQRSDTTKVDFAATIGFGNYEDRAALGLYTKLSVSRFGRSRLIEYLLSPAFGKAYGLIREREVDVVLDASGFLFSDQWGPEPAEQLVRQIRDRKGRQFSKLILLPQAFGPFTGVRIKEAFREIQRNADLIFAREKASYDHIESLGGHMDNVKIVPDFTNVVEGVIPSYWKPSPSCVLIIPNARMLDKAKSEESRSYLVFLQNCIDETIRRGLHPTLLLHSHEDHFIVQQLESENMNLSITYESDPLKIKGIIGTAFFVVASRFHALSSSLSQGIPAIGTGWSHKYRYMFDDYGCPQLLMSTQSSIAVLQNAFNNVIESHVRSILIEQISVNGNKLKQAVGNMWREVDSHIFL